MTDLYERLVAFLDVSGLDPEPQDDQLVQFWYKEERYYLRVLSQRQALRIFHPRVWSVNSHLEFGVATFIANDMNQDSFATKFFVNNDDHHVHIAVEVFASDAEASDAKMIEAPFFSYLNALSSALVEFRNRTDQSMQEEERS